LARGASAAAIHARWAREANAVCNEGGYRIAAVARRYFGKARTPRNMLDLLTELQPVQQSVSAQLFATTMRPVDEQRVHRMRVLYEEDLRDAHDEITGLRYEWDETRFRSWIARSVRRGRALAAIARRLNAHRCAAFSPSGR
jgi:hypothetical protein